MQEKLNGRELGKEYPSEKEQTENLFHTTKIRTYSGKYIDVFNLTPDDICIEDIAQGQVNTCRFGGQLKYFYSVLEHSLNVTAMVPSEHKVAAIFHDSFEGLTGIDCPSPIKKRLPDYMAMENNGMKVIAKRFGFQYPLHPIIKEADRICLQMEWDKYMIGQQKSPANREDLIEAYIALAEYLLSR